MSPSTSRVPLRRLATAFSSSTRASSSATSPSFSNATGSPGWGCARRQEALDLRAFIVSLQGAGVDFLPSDERAAAEIRRFGSAGLTRLLREALARYTLVVIDLGCPSREPVARTGGMAEAAVVLVELDRSAFETIKAAVAALRSAQIRVAGLALSGRALRAA
jgi:Mrp family chromosome partitioning ATPase